MARWSTAESSIALVAPQPLRRRTADEVAAWFDDDFLAPLHAIDSDEVVRLSAVYREREGGRRYAFHIPGYRGPRLLSGRPTAATRSRVLLPATPRQQRWRLGAAPGHLLVLADIERCLPVLFATVADDEALLAAARGDLHQAAGDAMAPHLSPAARRRIGKRFNNAVVGLVTPHGWRLELVRLGLDLSLDEARRMVDRWWATFDDARRWRDAWADLHRSAARHRRPLKVRYPDGRPYTFDVATVRGAASRPAWRAIARPEARLAAAIRTTFSAVWRGIEGVLLDEVIHRVHQARSAGLRLVLPMYDGLVLQVPERLADQLVPAVRHAFREAFAALGIPASVSIDVRPTWGKPTTSARCTM